MKTTCKLAEGLAIINSMKFFTVWCSPMGGATFKLCAFEKELCELILLYKILFLLYYTQSVTRQLLTLGIIMNHLLHVVAYFDQH